MARIRVSTTVDEGLFTEARKVMEGSKVAETMDAALAALVRAHRAAEIDRAYTAYDEHPIDEPDAWGDLASFGDGARRP
ncbi:MAG: DUF2191 domain-containing protein [Actinobacteria bacterium]|nr:DUF2191 domain-containing protein [Actinomycetota bacterium]